jgi:type II secretory pathway pseudopilin PulG
MTLAEILVSIVILGICIAALLGGTTSLPVAATVHRRDAQAEALLRNWADAIKAKGFVNSQELARLCTFDDSNPYAFDKLGGYLPDHLSKDGFATSAPVVATWNEPDVATWNDGDPVFDHCNKSKVKLVRVRLTVTDTSTVRPVSQSLDVVVASP